MVGSLRGMGRRGLIGGLALLLVVGVTAGPANAEVPTNDRFSEPTPVPRSVVNGTAYYDNIDATKQACESNHAQRRGGSSVWYKLIGRATRDRVYINTLGADFDTLLAVYYGGQLCHVLPIAANDNCPGVAGGSSCLSFVALPNTNYRIVVDGLNGAEGQFHFKVRRVVLPS